MRTDVFLGNGDDVEEALKRRKAYASSGASGFFVPGLTVPSQIRRFAAETPIAVNVMVMEGVPSNEELAKLCVSHMSYGALPYAEAMRALRDKLGSCFPDSYGWRMRACAIDRPKCVFARHCATFRVKASRLSPSNAGQTFRSTRMTTKYRQIRRADMALTNVRLNQIVPVLAAHHAFRLARKLPCPGQKIQIGIRGSADQ